MVFEEKYELVRQLVKDFAETEFTTEILDEIEETGEFPKDIYKKMAQAGFFGIKTPVEYGGAGFDHLAYAITIEEIARVSGVASIYISSPNSLAGTPILKLGTEEQKKKYIEPLVNGDSIICFALTEPGAGSDAGSMKTTADFDGDNYILNGRKTFITGAPLSDYGIVYAITDKTKKTKGISAFVVDLHSEGVSFGKPEKKMGMKGCATSDIILENVLVPKENILGREGQGFINAMATLDTGRIGVAAQSVGIGRAALEEAINYAKERKQFGTNIASFQGIKFMLAEMATKLEAATLLLYDAAIEMDAGRDSSKIASMAKFYCSEICNEICAKAVQIHGGYGYISDYKVERLYRDARVLTIYEGTSQIQQIVIAGKILK